MIYILRHLFGFLVHFMIGTAVIVAICCGFTLYDHGIDYRHTPQFAAQLHEFLRIGCVGGALYCLILIGYRTTRGALDPPPSSDNNLF